VIARAIPEYHGVRSPVPVLFVKNLAKISHKKAHREVVRVYLHKTKVDFSMIVHRQYHGDSRGNSGALLGVGLFLRLPCPSGVV
jgi:hypothetical protein